MIVGFGPIENTKKNICMIYRCFYEEVIFDNFCLMTKRSYNKT